MDREIETQPETGDLLSPICPQALEAIRERLHAARLRPTKQRLAIACLLYCERDLEGTYILPGGVWRKRHATAEQLHQESATLDIRLSLATVYNNLKQFSLAGLLKEIRVAHGQSYYDTNTQPHPHFFFKEENRIEDVKLTDAESERMSLEKLLPHMPRIPEGYQLESVEFLLNLNTDGS